MSATPTFFRNDDASQLSCQSHVFCFWFAITTKASDDSAVREKQGQRDRERALHAVQQTRPDARTEWPAFALADLLPWQIVDTKKFQYEKARQINL